MNIELTPEGTYPAYYKNYTQYVSSTHLLEELDRQTKEVMNFFNSISEEQGNFAYAPGKWTVKEVLNHIIDTERIITYRALCIARGEQNSLPGFEQDDYVIASKANHRSMHQLINEFIAVRNATKGLFESFTMEDVQRIGKANNHPVSVAAIMYMVIGHVGHHTKVIKERYLS